MLSQKPEKISLPEGWVWKTSKKYPGLVYYYNMSTGVSTWNFPQCDRLKSENQNREHRYESKTPNRTKKNNKRYSDAPLPKSKSSYFSSEKKSRKIASNEVTDITKNELKRKQNTSSNVDLPSKTPTEEQKPTAKKKRRRKRKAKLSVEETKLLANQSNPKAPENKDSGDKQVQSKRKKIEHVNTKLVEDLAKDKLTKSVCEVEEVSSSVVVQDIDMLDVSVDLTEIDDLPNNKCSSYYIIVDTNIFIHEISFIDEIKDTPLNNCGPPHIFIPWVVIQELENLTKRNSRSSDIFKLAHKGVRYINQILRAKHPRFHGQSPKEMKEWAQAYSRNNDDRVLECCISLAKKMPPEKVILLTNDVNLVNKAMICNISAYDIKSFMKLCKKLPDSLSVKNGHDEMKEQEKELVHSDVMQSECFNKLQSNIEYDEIMTKARQMLKDTLNSLLEIEMEEAYGAVWKAFKLDLTHLKGILTAFMKYWKMVFSYHFSIKEKGDFEFLLQVTDRPQGYLCDKKECLDILHSIEDIFCKINKKWPSIKPAIEDIKKFQSEVQNGSITECKTNISTELSNWPKNELSNKPSDDQVVLSVFEHNWVVLNHLTGMCLDFCQLPHVISYNRPAVFPPVSHFINLMCNLLPAVELIKQCMNKVVNKNSKNPPEIKTYNKFFSALKTFVPSLKIDIEPISMDFFTTAALRNYCDSLANQEKLALGYKQLETFCEKLSEVAAIISSNNSINSFEMVCES